MPRKTSLKAKSVTPAVPVVAEQTYSASELVQKLFELVPEIEEGGLSQADAILAVEDQGWIGGAQTSLLKGELTFYQRRNIILQCRMYWLRDPLAKQAVRLRTDYAVGTGVTYQCDDDSATIKLDAFWKNRKNKKLTTSRGQQSLMKKLLVDGELFFALFTDGDVPVLRTIDCLQVMEFISDPNDEQEVLCYKRVYGQPGKDQETLYYKDWAADDDDLEGLKDPETGKPITLETNVVVYHLPYDDLGKRGNSILSSVIYWTRQHREFMQARVALTQALAKFAHKLTTKGGQNVVNAIADRLNKGTESSGKHDPRGDGTTFVQNSGLDLQPLPRATGAGDARQDSDSLKLMHCAGTGTMLHYYGDPSCYSADTEVLTERGFMAHDQWQPGVQVATYNPDTQQIEFHHPQELRVFDYSGEMIRFSNAQTDILVTPNHRMWTAPEVAWKLLPAKVGVRNAGRPRIADGGKAQLDRSWRFSEARELQGNPRAHGWRFKSAAAYHSEDTDSVETPVGTVSAKAFARFLGYWLSEGSTLNRKSGRPNYRVQLAQREGAIAEKMRDTLRALGLRWNETANQSGCKMLAFDSKPLWTWLRNECGTGSHSKRIPAFMLEAGDGIRRELYEALMEGDGGDSGASVRYTSVSKQLADDMQRLALSLGYGAAVSLECREYQGAPHFIWRVWIRHQWTETKIRPKHVSSESYCGKVYCFHLPNHIYVTRRNGKIAIQGNTGNLATAEAMELPMLKSFTGDQELWKDCWRDIFSMVLEEDIDQDPEAIKVHMPPMLKDDLNKMGTFLMGMHQVFPEIQVDSILEMALIALGCPNVDETMLEIGKKREEMAQQQQELMKAAQSPLGNQLPQPSIKVSTFQTGSKNKPPAVKESVTLGDVLQSFAQQLEDVRQEISEGRKRDQQDQERETNERERALELAKLEWQESQSVAALNRLCQVIEKEPAPLLSESTIHRLLEGSKSKAIKMEKSGEISRDPATGKMRFVMQETPIEEANT